MITLSRLNPFIVVCRKRGPKSLLNCLNCLLTWGILAYSHPHVRHNSSKYVCRIIELNWDNGYDYVTLACVASVSNRVIARKLERKQKKVEGGGGGEKRKRLPTNPTILENAPWYFTVRFICKLTACQNRSITNRLPLDYQICKITLFSNRTRCRRLQEL